MSLSFKKTKIKPALAITDSQVFVKADASIPKDIPLTSFSIMLARFKGDFDNYLIGTPEISRLKDGDRVLLLESCAHHVSCDDIGRTKIPRADGSDEIERGANFARESAHRQISAACARVGGKERAGT